LPELLFISWFNGHIHKAYAAFVTMDIRRVPDLTWLVGILDPEDVRLAISVLGTQEYRSRQLYELQL
jgi:hypothetical protein